MIGLGTIVNSLAIVVGGLIGLFFGKFLNERYQETVVKTLGFATIMMALGSCMSKMLVVNIVADGSEYTGTVDTSGIMMMIISLAIGAFMGELADFEGKLNRFGEFLRDKSGNSGDGSFLNAFMISSLTVCVGAMAIMGAIEDGINADHSTLYAKAFLDLMIIMMMTASMGKGCIFSAIPVFLFQGSITILARFISPIMTDGAINNLSLVGNVLIFCVGINIVWPKTIRVANLLPAVVIAVVASFVNF